jgi:Tol biopolymer transport system component
MVACGFAFLLVAWVFCGRDEVDWGERASYILTTDTVSVIYVLDDTGALVASITPLKDSMQGIWSPTLIGASEKIAFLSREKPDYPPYLYITDRSGNELTTYEVPAPQWLDGSPTAPELIFTGKNRVSILKADEAKISSLFTDTQTKSEAVGTVTFTKAMAPAFSPSGEVVAFVNLGTYEKDTPAGPIPVPRADLGLVNRDGSNYRLLTGSLDDPLPATGNWLGIFWSHDGRWILAVREESGRIGTIYAMRYDESQTEVQIVPISKDWFKSYSYITASPTGDTLLLGTAPRHADLYVWEFKEKAGTVITGSAVGRLTDAEVYADPDWGPGSK